ncbi:hypothetical protein CUZ56_00617 [Saezia sanguinis]|uniref:Uncharacterized protein n=1 Tax=Saezia sanguinis TaxID=1965230 RepID=A0A433SHD6_9BURK|nr:hypothetical protein CUZ56_00617 [Saezia sanguinis]
MRMALCMTELMLQKTGLRSLKTRQSVLCDAQTMLIVPYAGCYGINLKCIDCQLWLFHK